MMLAIPIGISEDKYNINQAYVHYVAGAGYDPVLVTPENNLKSMAERVDGLVLPGGIDIDPIHYGDSNWGSFYCNPKKDDFERELFWACAIAGKPIFGICRGFQLIAREYMLNAGNTPVRQGSKTLVEDRMDFDQHIEDHEMTGRFNLWRHVPHHYIYARVDTLYGEPVALDNIPVNSMHHQAVRLSLSHSRLQHSNKVSEHLRALAWTGRGLDADEDDGVVCEAFVIQKWSKAPMMGVQWHPEELKDFRLLHSFFGQQAEAPMEATAEV